ncbi:MAG TPA: hypothetical protein VLF43_04320 [Candidatus Saccharimonadales bacterium]|nr:hypothetical protein [Candidatus Saccharimonadales bacterium]
MSSDHLLSETGRYIRAKQRELRQVPPEELQAFVVSSVSRLAIQYFEPLVHSVSQNVPETENTGLGIELINSGQNPIVEPASIQHLLPARVSRYGVGRNHNLMLPIEGRLLKVQTWAPVSNSPAESGDVSMQITGFDAATPSEAADYIEKRASFGDYIAPATAILLPSNEVSYGKWPDSKGYLLSARTRSIDIDNYSTPEGVAPLGPDDLSTLHSAFMYETQVALVGLRSLLQ